MKKIIWILRAAMYMRYVFSYWKIRDLRFCWETASVIYNNYEYEGKKPGDAVDEMQEELSCWND